MTVCHLDVDLLQAVLFCINPGIALCLCQMNSDRLSYMIQIPQDSFNLINCHFCTGTIRTADDAVRTSLYLEGKAFARNQSLKRYLRVIIRPHSSLYLPVQTSAHEHRFPVRTARCPVVDITAPKYELDQTADGYAYGLCLSIVQLYTAAFSISMISPAAINALM